MKYSLFIKPTIDLGEMHQIGDVLEKMGYHVTGTGVSGDGSKCVVSFEGDFLGLDEEDQEMEKPRTVPEIPPEAYQFDSFEVLGELDDEAMLFYSNVNSRRYRVTIRELNLDKLIQIGGEDVAFRVVQSVRERSAGQVLFADLKRRLIVKASEHQLRTPEPFDN